MKNVLLTGANGFIGKNLSTALAERFKDVRVLAHTRDSSREDLLAALSHAEFVYHLAGANRPPDPAGFERDNADATRQLCAAIRQTGRQIPVVYASSTQAERDNAYGHSKRLAEEALLELQAQTGSPVYVYRLPNVFGKWARPNYNSAVATFCHNIARDLPITIHDPSAEVQLVYIDDVVAAFLGLLGKATAGAHRPAVQPAYTISVGELASQIRAFGACRSSLITERVGEGLVRALYATYVSYLPPDAFAYSVPKYGDARGVFVEMLKTKDSGQFSFFTAHPGVTRGGHYHHSKTEKFLVLAGTARFRFRHIITQEIHEVTTSGDEPSVVETIPGWAHDITNIGSDPMVVMLWANEIFDRANPDTIAAPV